MELRKLLEGVEIKKITGDTLKEIEGIAYHSNQVKKGFLFAAIRGMEVDGHKFIGEAIQRGAEAVLLEKRRRRELPTRRMIFVPNSRQALARISSNFYGNPSSQVRLIGITGTNGKTTTTYLLESIFKKAGYVRGRHRDDQLSVRSKGNVQPPIPLQNPWISKESCGRW